MRESEPGFNASEIQTSPDVYFDGWQMEAKPEAHVADEAQYLNTARQDVGEAYGAMRQTPEIQQGPTAIEVMQAIGNNVTILRDLALSESNPQGEEHVVF